jgi:2-succinyl-5-enolpyruvyl-6-hydroxy-3-cyclohexene-1-carboxylate synthase
MIVAHKNVRILVSLLKQHGIRHLVLSPGGRNMSIVKSIEDDPYFTCYSVVDERSAAYFAVGLYLEVLEPIGICCTSAQATRNFLPGMTEAYYRKAPILSITADYDANMTDQMNMQSFRQLSVPSDSTKISVDLPIVKDTNDEHLVTRRVNEALDALTRNGGGPSHINVRINQHWVRGDDTLEKARKITRNTIADQEWPDLRDKKILLVIGQHHAFSPTEMAAIELFAASHDTAIYVNHISNYNGMKSVHGNLRLSAGGFGGLEPDLLITIGGMLGDYALDGALKNTKIEHWRVCQDGEYGDTYNSLTRVFECTEQNFFNRITTGAHKQGSSSYYKLWLDEIAKMKISEELPLSHALVASSLSRHIPTNAVLHFAILNSMRFWEFFNLDPSIRCYSNVAGFGIDGCMSTFLGQSVATDNLCFLIIGDLSFFYDMNSIGIRHLKNNVRIVLVNNRGGGEFRLKSSAADGFGDLSNRHIAAGGHFGDSAEGWVRNNGFKYIPVRKHNEMTQSISAFLEPSDFPVLMEVFTTMNDDAESLQSIIRENDLSSNAEKLAKSIKQAIPTELKAGLKKILGR